MVVDIGKFDLPEPAMPQLRDYAQRAHQSLKDGERSKLEEEWGALFTFLLDRGKRISLVDPRPVDLILPSPNADYDMLRRIFNRGE